MDLNKIKRFSLHYFLINIFWIAPTFIICLYKPIFLILYIPFLITYTYLWWLVKNKVKTVSIQPNSKIIVAMYWISILVFLFLTLWSTYNGIISVFGISNNNEKIFAAIFSFGIVITLLGIILMIKSRNNPGLILGLIVLYIFFDMMTALPFNFLFFYKNSEKVANVEHDKLFITSVINKCDSVLSPKYANALEIIRKLEDGIKVKNSIQTDLYLKQLEAEKSTWKILYNENGISMEEYNNRIKSSIKKYFSQFSNIPEKDFNSLITAKTDSNSISILLNYIKECRILKLQLDRAINYNLAEAICDSIRNKLIGICNQSRDSVLQANVVSLYPIRVSQLTSIEELYKFIINDIITFNNNDTKDTPRNYYNSDYKMLIWVSLATSIIIDILPLLFSLIYVRFKKEI